MSCCSAWLRGDLWLGRWSFESVNQVLVRLWACLVAATDRMVGLLLRGWARRPAAGLSVQGRVKCAE